MKQLSSTREVVLQRLRRALPHLRRRYGVVRLSLYGSFARGAAGKDSDVDLLVELSRPLGLEFVALAQYLERKLGRKVDLATFETFRRSLTLPRYRDIAVNIQESLADVQEEAR
ncbi:MAG: nucleotidyltransferase [Deltaproteobacteria bacterium]|nr:nucleotidyltransferase [Deltaproteobacteria bacterium]